MAADALTHLQAVQAAAAADPAAPAAADLLGEWSAYQGDLTAAADLVAERSSVPSADFVTAWTATSNQRMTVVLAAMSLGVPYRFAGAKPGVGLRLFGPHHVGLGPDRCGHEPRLHRPDPVELAPHVRDRPTW